MHNFKIDNNIYTLLFLFDDCNEISMQKAIEKTGLNRSSIVRRVEKINVSLRKYNSYVIYEGKTLKLNLNNEFTSIWNIDSFDYLLICEYLVEEDFYSAIKKIEDKHYLSVDQIKYKLKNRYNETYGSIKMFDRKQTLYLFLRVFSYTFNDYNARLIYKQVSHGDILDFIKKHNIIHASSYDYLLIFAYLLCGIEDEQFIEEMSIKSGNKSYTYDIKVYKIFKKNKEADIYLKRALMHLNFIEDNDFCFTTRNTEFKYYEFVLEYDIDFSKRLFKSLDIEMISHKYIFLNYLAMYYISNELKNVKHISSDNITLVNVDEYAVLFYAYIRLSLDLNLNVKMISSFKYYENENKFENAFVNSKLNSKYRVLPMRDVNNKYNKEDF